MSARIKYKGDAATAQGGTWESASPALLELLELLEEPKGYYPDLDDAMAAEAVAWLGAEIVFRSPPEAGEEREGLVE